MGTNEEPRRRAPVAAEKRRRQWHRAARARSVEADRALHAHDRLVAAGRPGLRKDLAAFPGESRSVCRRVCARLVQADAPRHGSALALPRAGGSGGRTPLAGSDSRGRSPADRRAGHRLAEEQDSRFRSLRLGAGFHRVGLGLHLPWIRQARRRKRRPHSPRAAEGLGGQPAGSVGQSAQELWKASRARSMAQRPAARKSRSPT